MNEILQMQNAQNIKVVAMSSFSTEIQIILVSMFLLSQTFKDLLYLKKDKIYSKYNEICGLILHEKTNSEQLNENL